MTSTHVANFGVRFCNELNSNTNCICSPLSVETLLALMALGCRNRARAEIFQALDIPNEDNLRSTFTSLTSILHQQNEQANNITLKIANKIYVAHVTALKEGLKTDAEKIFKSSLEQIDFTKRVDAARSINNWVSNQTNDIIKGVVTADTLNKNTRLVLGFWEISFKASDTHPREFHVNNTKKVKIDIMSKGGILFNYKHSPELDAKILQMFYKGREASMVIVLPDEIEGINDVMTKLTDGYDLMADIKSLERSMLNVAIPKFTIETEINLKELLPKMGIKRIFECSDDINMIYSDDHEFFCVSEAIQKAFIAVDEKGTEAAAATGLHTKRCVKRPKMNTFIADRPFFYLLTTEDIPIFYGLFYGQSKCTNEIFNGKCKMEEEES